MTKKFDGKWYRRQYGEMSREAAEQFVKVHGIKDHSYVRIVPEKLNGIAGFSIFIRPKKFPSGTVKSAEEWNRICRKMHKEG